MRNGNWRRRVLLLAGLGLGLAGCGNLTSGGVGEVEVVLSSDEVEELGIEMTRALALEANGIGAWETVPSFQTSSERPVIEGTLTVRVRSFVRRGRDDWEELTDGLQEVTVSLDRPEPVEVARRSLPEGRYDAVRTIFGRVEAEVVRGLRVGEEPVTGTIQVDLGPEGTLTLLNRVDLVVREQETALVVLEMQSGIWLRLVDAARRSVLRDDFRQVFRVRTGTRN